MSEKDDLLNVNALHDNLLKKQLWHCKQYRLMNIKKITQMTSITRALHFFFNRFIRPTTPLINSRHSKNSDKETMKLQSKSLGPIFNGNITGKENSLFKAAKENNVKELLRLLNGKDTNPHERGETILHIAVVNQNVMMVKELLSRNADTKNARARGSFFSPGKGQCYYGEYVLSFAACMGNEKIVQLLIKSGAPLNVQDTQGNTVLHMLVLHPNKTLACRMYDYLLSLITIDKIRYLESITNNDGFTSMKLAVHKGDVTTFNHFIKRRKQVYWAFGPVTSTLYDLTGIDTWEDELSVLDIICTSKEKNVRELLELTPVKEVLHHKWTNWGYKFFFLWTVLYIFHTVIFTICCVYRPLEPIKNNMNVTIMNLKPLSRSYELTTDFLRLAGEIVTVLGAFCILITEIPRLVHIGPTKYFGNTVTGGPFHIIMILYGLLIVTAMILRFAGSDGQTTILALALICAWCNVIYFARGFELLGPLCIMIQKMIFGDLMRFCSILILVIIGFAAAFDVHFQALNPDVYVYFSDFPITTFTLFQLMMGLTDLPGPPLIPVPDIIIFLYMIYMFFAFVLLLNVLIALMGDTHYRVVHERRLLWKAQIAATILLLERRLPKWLLPRLGIPGDAVGLEEGKWYFRIEERNDNFHKRGLKKIENNVTHNIRKNRNDSGWNLIHTTISSSVKSVTSGENI
ncbi:transient receptor potential cation channel subfamily V member 6-like isoform X2 [Polypterus senegalus]|uniref:transient receptor potential cation channel subfamily V member 6-like isoform X2 n=1 Tax=Polypterus senegalus TaxID=55291 RepID=UPI001962DCA9|nr:transient receptor potential cation channel subfamily V member 6-like isoform X2 [Polypterus senegalus]